MRTLSALLLALAAGCSPANSDGCPNADTGSHYCGLCSSTGLCHYCQDRNAQNTCADACTCGSGNSTGGGCPSNAPLSCNAWCCPYGQNSRKDVCCDSNPQSSGCTSNGNCSSGTGGGSGGGTGGGATSCPSTATINCSGWQSCPNCQWRSCGCVDPNGYNGGYCGEWYESNDGQKFECAGSNSGCANFSQSSCLAAAQGLINHCCQ